jgi:hypothetical protein
VADVCALCREEGRETWVLWSVPHTVCKECMVVLCREIGALIDAGLRVRDGKLFQFPLGTGMPLTLLSEAQLREKVREAKARLKGEPCWECYAGRCRVHKATP